MVEIVSVYSGGVGGGVREMRGVCLFEGHGSFTGKLCLSLKVESMRHVSGVPRWGARAGGGPSKNPSSKASFM